MKCPHLGRRGLIVSELCLGTMNFGENNKCSTSSIIAEKMIGHYPEQGGNHIDTANV